MDIAVLAGQIREARARTLECIAGLSDAQLRPPLMSIVNPFVWEAGHVAFFQELFVLRALDCAQPLIANADALFDSTTIAHNDRWELPLPSLARVQDYLRRVAELTVARLRQGASRDDLYRNWLAVAHEDMHAEAFTYMRQTLAYPAPSFDLPRVNPRNEGPLPGDASVPGGLLRLGADPGDGFVLDNEQWAHEVTVPPFRIAKAPVTQAEFAAFVDDGGYARRELWRPAGWEWREYAKAAHPLYWRKSGNGWQRRHFDQWRDLEPHRPVVHLCWHEAEAWCRWAGRRLPTEAEWEMAAACEPAAGGVAPRKRHFPWGDTAPTAAHVNMDWHAMDTVDVAALAPGDSAFGCRQMIGNVWEWTSSTFLPFPGFEIGPYREYSEPLFWTRKVLRGGCWASRSRMLRNTWRNFFTPNRRDVFAGFRTCALP